MARLVSKTALLNVDGGRSFHDKAIVRRYDDGTEVLSSYGTDVITRKADGALARHWDDWSATTGRHLFAFCGIRKADWDKMAVVEVDREYSC